MVTTLLPGSPLNTDFLSPRTEPGPLPPMGFAVRLSGERDTWEGVVPLSPSVAGIPCGKQRGKLHLFNALIMKFVKKNNET